MDKHLKYTYLSASDIYHTICLATLNGTYASYLRGKRLHTDEDAIWAIATSFQFPDYFGGNWNAVDECLGDLEWLNPKAVLVVVEDFSKSFDGDEEAQQHLAEKFKFMIENQLEEGVEVEVLLNN